MLSDLAWLPPPPPDFREQLSAIRRDPAAEGLHERLVALTSTALDETQLSRLARLAGDIAALDRPPGGFLRVKLGLVGDGTLSLLGPAIAGSALRHSLLVQVVEGHYGSAIQEATDPSSHLRTAGLDMLLIAGDARLLGLDRAAGSPQDAEAAVDSAFQRLKLIADGLRPAVSAAILVQTVPPPLEPLFGSFDRLQSATVFSMVEALNRRIVEWAASGAVVLVDIARLASSIGLERWDDPAQWQAAKMPFAPAMLPAYGEVVARTLAALRGKTKKCLVLDLDNTLWGGVIGDDGVGGIKLGQGSAAGEAHLAVQRLALELRARGVILAVCSKNEDDAARLPFREHPDMLLREDHIAVFQANWNDKAANLRAIAEALNIGVDALVFLDDNPAERLQVRRELPLVAVPEIGSDPSAYARLLAAAGYFEAVAFSAEDRQRAEYYQANAERAAMLTATGDIGAYLASLDMVCTIAPVDALSRARTAQLINKSNQFNLTTRRYTEAEVASIEHDPARHMIQVRLVDRFGDNGLIGVIVADVGGARWEIDTWLMSCRVLKRRVEEACLNHLVAAARAAGALELIGRYIPSPKNRMVAGHYQGLGFERVEALDDEATVWRLDVDAYVAPQLEMRVDDLSLAAPVKAAS